MKAKAVIVGGGVLGLSLAYQLALRGWKDLVVCEKSHLNAGASARCAGGIRTQWSTADNIELMLESQRFFETFPQRIGVNIWFRQQGYLFLAKNQDQADMLAKNVKLQNECGVPSRILSPHDIKRLVPDINLDCILCGSYNEKDGVLFPFPVLWGYAAKAKELGVKILTFTEVKDIETKSGRITKVITNKDPIETEMVINAAGAWSPEIGKMAGIALPNKPEKHESLVTEPLRPFLRPNLIPMDTGMFVEQTMRGEINACVGMKTAGIDYDSSFAFARKVSKLLVDLIPKLSNVKALRQWAGYYDITPDTKPILGPVKGLENFIQFHGFMGHGFMMAPVMGRIIADYLVSGKEHSTIQKCRLERFEKGVLEAETMIIG